MNYKQYLASDDWQMLRQKVIDNQEGQCSMCGRDIAEVHHLTYPKKWNEDCVENLVGLCGLCHMKEHGIYKPKEELEIVRTSIWDFVLVHVNNKINERIYEPTNPIQCVYSKNGQCINSYRKKRKYCENYQGKTDIDGQDYVICDNREYEEDLEESDLREWE